MITNRVTEKNLNFETLFAHDLDRRVAGRTYSQIDETLTYQHVEDTMLEIIKRYGLTRVLLCELKLYSLNEQLVD